MDAMTIERYQSVVKELEERLNKACRRNMQLYDALTMYGNHLPDCFVAQNKDAATCACTCDLVAVMVHAESPQPHGKEGIDPGEWLRKRPEVCDNADEFLRDFEHWATLMLGQEGLNWGEYVWFAQRASYLRHWKNKEAKE